MSAPHGKSSGKRGKSRGKGKGGAGGKDDAGAPATISDPRFAHVHSDPRFQQLKKASRQTVVDSRFQRMFSDPKFNVLDGSVDKRGRRIGKNAGLAELTKLYRPDAPEAVDVEGKAAATAKRDIELNAKLARLNAVARGEVDVGSSSSDDSSDSDSEEVDLAVEDEVLALPEAARGEAPRTTLAGHETRRLAAVDMDWEHISSVDILAALQSFCPTAGKIERVTVYPSEYGQQRLAEEARLGPRGIWASGKDGEAPSGGVSTDEEEEDEDVEALEFANRSRRKKRSWREGGFDKARLRQYELNKLKYYFAVIECDSPATANSIYTQCDGMEYERTSNMFNLQFIPDDVSVSTTPRDKATSVPRKYKPQPVANPMQQSVLEPTWDQPDTRRVRKMRWELGQQGDVDEEAFRAYLASSSDSDSAASSIIDPDASDGEGEVDGTGKRKLRLSKKQRDVRNKYKSLLEGLVEFEEDDGVESDASGSNGDDEGSGADEAKVKKQKKKKKKKKKKKSKDDDEMMAWGAGEEVLKRLQEKKAHENETVFERDQRKLKEKRKAKRAARKAAAEGGAGSGKQEQGGSVLEGDGFFVDDSLENDPFFAGARDDDGAGANGADSGAARRRPRLTSAERAEKRAKRAADREAREREAAELELLMLNEHGEKAPEGFDKRAIVKAEKMKGKKGRKKKKRGKNADDGFHPDVQDPRFAAVFEDPQFSIDPTNAQFKDTREMREILDERQRRRAQKRRSAEAAAEAAAARRAAGGATAADDAGVADDSAHMAALVQSLKRRLPAKQRREPAATETAAASGGAGNGPSKKKRRRRRSSSGGSGKLATEAPVPTPDKAAKKKKKSKKSKKSTQAS